MTRQRGGHWLDGDPQGCLFTEEDLKPRPPAPVVPPQWAGFPQGPARDRPDGCWTGPCLYASPARGRAARLAEYELWRQLFGTCGCACDSHAWRPALHLRCEGPMDRHEPFLLDCDLRRFRTSGPLATPVPPCGHDADWLAYRSACLMDGCDWEGPERAGENPAVEDGMDHAWPGWRDLPVVPRVPDRNPTSKQARKTLDNWAVKVNAVYPEFWLENGGPIRTLRRPFETRHVEGGTPWGGYDLGVPKTGPRGFPLCKGPGKRGGAGDCGAEGIGATTPWCIGHWTPERDPEGAAGAERLGLLPDPQQVLL